MPTPWTGLARKRAPGNYGPMAYQRPSDRSIQQAPESSIFDLARIMKIARMVALCSLVTLAHCLGAAEKADSAERKLLYVATPGIRDYLEYGGHGVLVFDIGAGHKFVKRIPSAGLDEKGQPLNVKGICANAKTRRLFVTTTRTLMSFDLVSGKLLWEKPYEGGCDRMAISPEGTMIYLPSLEKEHWHVVDALSGEV